MFADMKIKCISPWLGSKRSLAPKIVRQLGPHRYYCELCCGSLAVLFAKPPSEHELVCDLHGGVTNLAWVLKDQGLAFDLFSRLQTVQYHDDIFEASKTWLEDSEAGIVDETPNLEWAYHYLIASWQGRNGIAGTDLTNYQIATRWTALGGSSPLRFKSAVESIPAWCERLGHAHILRRDMFQVLQSIEDALGTAIYIDPPYLPQTKANKSTYRHEFAAADHRRLADMLQRFRLARVVVSYYDCEELTRLYPPAAGWNTIDCSRHKHTHTQSRRGSRYYEAPEVLIVNGEPVPEEPAEQQELLFN
jgi:DNA adenine methylase